MCPKILKCPRFEEVALDRSIGLHPQMLAGRSFASVSKSVQMRLEVVGPSSVGTILV